MHGQISRRQFLDRAAAFSATGLSGAALLELLSPNYALAEQVSPQDESIVVAYRDYDSPRGAGVMRGYLAMPAAAAAEFPGVVVIHENRGLNPYIEDVARRLAVAGFIAFAPDALTPLGGYPGNDDEGRTMQQQRDSGRNAARFRCRGGVPAETRRSCTGKVGVRRVLFRRLDGQCAGGECSEPGCGCALLRRSAGRGRRTEHQRAAADFIMPELDERVNTGWPAYRAALEAAGKRYTEYSYAACQHGFHNDTTPRYDESAAVLAWERTIEFFRQNLV